MMEPVTSLVLAMAESHALDSEQLGEVRRLAPRYPNDPRGLAGELLKRQWLTPFQINRLNAGRGQELLLGSYVLLERLGEGGMGQVFKARNWKLGRTVALKVIRKELLTNPTVIARFRREIEATANLDHPNIIRAFDADQTDAGLFIVMEYMDGIDLGRMVKEQGPVPPVKVCEYVRQAAQGLQHAHERGLIHRDIKPPNLLVDPQTDVLKILDLGLARLQESSDSAATDMRQPALTQLGIIVGTVDFIAPEQARDSRNVDIRADLYALGCTACFLLTGRVPFHGGTATEKLLKHTLDPLPALLEVAPPVRAIVHRLMAKQPSDRFQTPTDLVQALNLALAHPDKLEGSHSVDLLPPTVPSITLPPPTRLVQELAGRPPSPIGTAEKLARPVGRVSDRRCSSSRQTAPVAEVISGPSRATPSPRLPVAVILDASRVQPAPAHEPAALRRRRRSRSLYAVLVSLIAGAVVAFPLLSPAPATQGESPVSEKLVLLPPVEKPEGWDGVVREFLILGPFGRNTLLAERIERNPDPDATHEGPLGALSWRSVVADEAGALKSPNSAWPRPGILFSQVHIHSPAERKIKLLTSSADEICIRLNGSQIYRRSDIRKSPKVTDDQIEVPLKEGWNAILIRLHARGQRPFETYLGFQDAARLRPALRPEN